MKWETAVILVKSAPVLSTRRRRLCDTLAGGGGGGGGGGGWLYVFVPVRTPPPPAADPCPRDNIWTTFWISFIFSTIVGPNL